MNTFSYCYTSFFLSMSVKIFGFHCPTDFFIHCQTKNPKSASFHDLYSATCFSDSLMTASTIASRAQVSLVCLSPSFSTHSLAFPPSNTSFSITSLLFVDESSSAFTIFITSATSTTPLFTCPRSIFS